MLPGRVERWERELNPHWLRIAVGGVEAGSGYLRLCSIVAANLWAQEVAGKPCQDSVALFICVFFFFCFFCFCTFPQASPPEKCLFRATLLWMAASPRPPQRTGALTGCPGAVCCRDSPRWRGTVRGWQQMIRAAGVKLVSNYYYMLLCWQHLIIFCSGGLSFMHSRRGRLLCALRDQSSN